jgi:hypothetical protein
MSDLLDKAKDLAKDLSAKTKDAVTEHSDQIDDGIDKAADFVDEKTKGKYADKISSVQTKAHEAVGKMAEGKGPGDGSASGDTPPS